MKNHEHPDWPAQGERQKNPMVTEDQIKHMVNRFLGWRIPSTFNPDAGISYTPPSYAKLGTDTGPTGTNIFDADQTEAMVRYMLEGLPGCIPRIRTHPSDCICPDCD